MSHLCGVSLDELVPEATVSLSLLFVDYVNESGLREVILVTKE